MDLCKQASELAHNVIFNIILVTVVIISTLAIFFEIWIMFKTTNRILLHQNIRILITVHQLWLIIHCIARIFAHTYVLVTYWKTHADPCGYMALPWECFMMRTPITLTLFLNSASIPSIVIERAIATYFSSRYEKFSKSVGVILVIVQSTIGIGGFAYLASDFELFDSEKRFRRNKIHANLSQRYQIMENINSIRILLPMIAFYSVLAAFYMGALFLPFAVNLKFSDQQFAVYLESVQQIPIYALTLPTAIVWTEKHVRKTNQKNRQKAIDLKGNEAANHYFAIFEKRAEKNG
uniref:G-protein coupled receptors family 1 profile domain-containing protein n=1 Tax=Onchocerca volvulus TaxID=6282 RepID=A0A8R1XNJ3_ONCVO